MATTESLAQSLLQMHRAGRQTGPGAYQVALGAMPTLVLSD